MSSMPKKGNEQKTVKRKVRTILTKWDWFWWGNAASQFSRSGISDISAVKTGIFMVIETKFNLANPSQTQIGFLNSVAMNDGFAFVVNEKNVHWLEVFCARMAEATRKAAHGKVASADIGGPLLDAIKALTDFPRDIAEAMRYRERTMADLAVDTPDPEEIDHAHDDHDD